MPEGTARSILALLREGRAQAQHLASALSIDTSAVRRHLDGLAAEGLVDSEDVIDGPGRPKKMFGITAAGREVFHRDYALLLDLLIKKAEAEWGQNRIENLISLIAKDLGRRVEGRTVKERLDAMVALYNALGFEASLEKHGPAVVLVQRNCIFLKTARGNPRLICECLDEGLVRAALPGSKVELEGSLAVGHTLCRHRIHPPGPRH